jgi:hypothetical protein
MLAYHENKYLSMPFSKMSHNVSAVGDVLPARIRALRSKDQGWQNVPEQRRGNEAQRNDLASRNPEPPTGGEALTDLLYDVGQSFYLIQSYLSVKIFYFLYFVNNVLLTYSFYKIFFYNFFIKIIFIKKTIKLIFILSLSASCP